MPGIASRHKKVGRWTTRVICTPAQSARDGKDRPGKIHAQFIPNQMCVDEHLRWPNTTKTQPTARVGDTNIEGDKNQAQRQGEDGRRVPDQYVHTENTTNKLASIPQDRRRWTYDFRLKARAKTRRWRRGDPAPEKKSTDTRRRGTR